MHTSSSVTTVCYRSPSQFLLVHQRNRLLQYKKLFLKVELNQQKKKNNNNNKKQQQTKKIGNIRTWVVLSSNSDL